MPKMLYNHLRYCILHIASILLYWSLSTLKSVDCTLGGHLGHLCSHLAQIFPLAPCVLAWQGSHAAFVPQSAHHPHPHRHPVHPFCPCIQQKHSKEHSLPTRFPWEARTSWTLPPGQPCGTPRQGLQHGVCILHYSQEIFWESEIWTLEQNCVDLCSCFWISCGFLIFAFGCLISSCFLISFYEQKVYFLIDSLTLAKILTLILFLICFYLQTWTGYHALLNLH